MAPAAVDANDQVHLVDVEVVRPEFSADYGRLEEGDIVEMELPLATKWVRLGIGKCDEVKGTEKTTGRVRRARQAEEDVQNAEAASAAQYSSMIGGGQAGLLISRLESRIAELEGRLGGAQQESAPKQGSPKSEQQPASKARGTAAQRRAQQDRQESKNPATMTVGDANADGPEDGPPQGKDGEPNS